MNPGRILCGGPEGLLLVTNATLWSLVELDLEVCHGK